MNLLKDIAKETFQFLSSLKLAVLLLIAFTILLTWSTIYESMTSTEQAQEMVYRTAWFDFLIFLLGINVTCSTFSRWPWKKRHTGFVITHLGIIIILLGSMVTRKYGVEGQLFLEEGETGQQIMLPADTFILSAPRLNESKSFDPWFIDQGLPSEKSVLYNFDEAGIECYVSEYLMNPRQREIVTNEGNQPNPAIEVVVERQGTTGQMARQWLFANIQNRKMLDLSGAQVHFHRADSPEALERWLRQPSQEPAVDLNAPRGTINIQKEGETLTTLAVPDLVAAPQSFLVDDASYTAYFDQYLPNAGIQQGQLVNKEDGSFNPTIRFEIEGPAGREEHLAFALFPQLGSVHGGQAPNGLNAVFQYPLEDVAPSQGNRVDLVADRSGQLHYRAINETGGYQSGLVEEGEPIQTTWNNITLTVDRYYETATRRTEMFDAGPNAPGPHNNPMVRLRLMKDDQEAQTLVNYNASRTVMVGDEPVVVEFGRKRYPLGFAIQLIDFRAPKYPGTTRPSRFESEVKLLDAAEAIEEETRIYMNNPLYHDGYAVYQSSYVEGQNGQPDISIFSVAKAPGTPIIYIGSIVMILGMTIMFTSTKYGRRKPYSPPEEQKNQTAA